MELLVRPGTGWTLSDRLAYARKTEGNFRDSEETEGARTSIGLSACSQPLACMIKTSLAYNALSVYKDDSRLTLNDPQSSTSSHHLAMLSIQSIRRVPNLFTQIARTTSSGRHLSRPQSSYAPKDKTIPLTNEVSSLFLQAFAHYCLPSLTAP
jgi:hypothetical protein